MTHNDEAELIKKNLSMISKREMMDMIKEAFKELVIEHVAVFGWWSLKTLGVAIMGAMVIIVLYVEGWAKQ